MINIFGNLPGSLSLISRQNTISLVNWLGKPKHVDAVVNKAASEILLNTTIEKTKTLTNLHTAIKTFLLRSGYPYSYNANFVNTILSLKILITAVYLRLHNVILTNIEPKIIAEDDKDYFEKSTNILQQYVNIDNSIFYPVLLPLEFIPADIPGLIADIWKKTQKIDDELLKQLFLTPTLLYFSLVNHVMHKTYKTLLRTNVYTDSIVFLFLYVRYYMFNRYYNKLLQVKLKNVIYDELSYKVAYKLYLENYVDKYTQLLSSYIGALKGK